MAGPGQAGEDIAVVRRPRWPWRIAGWFGGAVLLLFALLALGVYLLDTGPGHRFVSDRIERLRFENGLRIRVGRIDGSLYGAMVLRNLSFSDTKGEFLFSPEVRVDWRPFAWLRSHVDVRSLTAQRMILRRAPVLRPTVREGPLLPDMDVDIGKLRIDRFIAEPALTGNRRIARLDGRAHIASGRAQVRFEGRMIAGQGRGGGDRVTLVLDAVPAANRLGIEVGLNAPQGGVIATLAGLRQPLAVRVAGQGDWKRWAGRLNADLGGQELARFRLAAHSGTFAIRGPARLAMLTTGPAAALLGSVTRIDLTAALRNRRADLIGSIASEPFSLAAKGIVDLSDNSFEDLRLAFALKRPAVLAGNLAGADMRAKLTLNGAFTGPRIAYALSADRLT
ncbi:MAG: hypothetical protein LBV50_00855, partial [Novosphingobium sp.]|nr:hypothetical protein [Novosphingobium sp.]